MSKSKIDLEELDMDATVGRLRRQREDAPDPETDLEAALLAGPVYADREVADLKIPPKPRGDHRKVPQHLLLAKRGLDRERWSILPDEKKKK